MKKLIAHVAKLIACRKKAKEQLLRNRKFQNLMKVNNSIMILENKKLHSRCSSLK
jgi:citrate lyase synthetase